MTEPRKHIPPCEHPGTCAEWEESGRTLKYNLCSAHQEFDKDCGVCNRAEGMKGTEEIARNVIALCPVEHAMEGIKAAADGLILKDNPGSACLPCIKLALDAERSIIEQKDKVIKLYQAINSKPPTQAELETIIADLRNRLAGKIYGQSIGEPYTAEEALKLQTHRMLEDKIGDLRKEIETLKKMICGDPVLDEISSLKSLLAEKEAELKHAVGQFEAAGVAYVLKVSELEKKIATLEAERCASCTIHEFRIADLKAHSLVLIEAAKYDLQNEDSCLETKKDGCEHMTRTREALKYLEGEG